MAKSQIKSKTAKVKASKGLSEAEIEKLEQSGTKEAIAKLEKYINAETDAEKRALAEIALERCEFIYYEPKNDKEEEEFFLCAMIRKREQEISDLIDEAASVQVGLDKMLLEKKIHDRVLAKNKDKKEAWQYNFIGDIVSIDSSKLEQLEDNIAYEEAWVAEARKMITTARYKTMPVRHLEHFDFELNNDVFEDNFDDEELEDFYDEDSEPVLFNDYEKDDECGSECDCGENCCG